MSDPELRDEIAAAMYAYTQAVWDYEDALARREPGMRTRAEAALQAAARRLSQAQAAVVERRGRPVTFGALLSDPTQQLDPESVVLASIRVYQNAAKATADAASAARSEAQIKAEALREQAVRFREDGAEVWGRGIAWMTTGDRVAALVASWCDEAAVELEQSSES